MSDLIICGIGGKMGRAVYEAAKANDCLNLVGGVDLYANKALYDCPVFNSFKEVNVNTDVIIDFSRPESLDGILEFALKNNCALVLATTGYSPEQVKAIEKAAKTVPVFMSANFSLGVNVVAELCRQAAKALGYCYDIEIIEKHHNQKVDAPSGTALLLANEINEVFGGAKQLVYGREGKNCKRDDKEIGIHAVRGGTIIGEHEIIFTANDETVTISHSAQSKQIFAGGAIRAAVFLSGKKPGMYCMNDIIR